MNDKMKEALKRTSELLEQIEETVEERIDELPKDARKLWTHARFHVTSLGDHLRDASAQLEGSMDHAALQAHLATMDAYDHWQQLQETVGHVLGQAKREAGAEVDYARLQAHLAAMNSRDYLGEKEQEISDEYNKARTQLEAKTLQMATDLQQKFEGLINGLPR
ncbi:hypothetical protein [Pseudomaricurvus sp. HS19]|uniref:hypothetical protein n=1 Tax=Pseudomaricurvus sp. HS19 TaxID=2692626 RepID=UPI00136B394C|nr:hypothetical protein [Pseudomaricurvus sp. HS19]MYM62064.1 hypothetical protein [Pseudomaricurvus sp. HS19]